MIKIGTLLKDIQKETLKYKNKNPHVYWALYNIISEIYMHSLERNNVEVGFDNIFGDYTQFEGTDKQQLSMRKEAMTRLEKVNKVLKNLGFNSEVICHYGYRDDKSFWICSPFIYVRFKGK